MEEPSSDKNERTYAMKKNNFVTLVMSTVGGILLAIGMCMSAATRNQVVAFITAALVGFVFLLAGFPLVLDFVHGVLPQTVVDAIASLSFFTHFDAISKGVIDVRDLVYFAALIGFWSAATALVLDMKKAQS